MTPSDRAYLRGWTEGASIVRIVALQPRIGERTWREWLAVEIRTEREAHWRFGACTGHLQAADEAGYTDALLAAVPRV
jgi:hypothetical protein